MISCAFLCDNYNRRDVDWRTIFQSRDGSAHGVNAGNGCFRVSSSWPEVAVFRDSFVLPLYRSLLDFSRSPPPPPPPPPLFLRRAG
jgi:hypothetical protein